MSEITLYHGSSKIIERPAFGTGNSHNDYGLGFYCTQNAELAKEWACGTRTGGFANVYTIDVVKLHVLHLDAHEYGILGWLALLVNHRTFSIGTPIMAESKEYLSTHFLPDIKGFDAIRGYRADDSYFTFAMDFLGNAISLRQLSAAMRLGLLGEQFVLKSPLAFDMLVYLRSEPADGEIYFAKRQQRDRQALEAYLQGGRHSPRQRDDLFMLDILRGELKHDDARLQGHLSA